ncbi:histidinol-phosphate transaminase [Halogeometricum borinquense]|uniref:Histidinol-phosphate aminotransferase n=1 Tax=Halogeometricum borinquense TaxID=60847 RepID=A0A6C0UFA1_9EURY|nr:histidinol-phosphate transaminase [Halogeometricum borinquense]QIB73890.1 histidinol-phosphate transaminase [Halogeometricum borinquense]QIQ76746.1 histidinol-phosphate transaminase [Halogeometricum borinquense]
MQPRDLSAHEAYVPGRGAEEVARELGMNPEELTKLSSNENPHGPSPDAVEAVEAAASEIHVYPKTSHADLTDALAERWDLTSEQVWVSAGGDGALDNLSRAFLEPGDRVLTPEPGFSYYAMSARYHHGEVVEYSLSKIDDFAQTPETILDAYDGERIVYLTTPHNPTGSEMAREDIVTLLESVEDHTLVVVDEAYGEYSEEPSAIGLLDEYDNLAVIRTFSKAFGLAGLRIGYAAVPEAWADAYARVNTPFAASKVACRAALAALGNEEHIEKSVETARWAREYYRDELNTNTWPSGGNFVLVEVGDATAVAEATKRRGIIVRDTSSFGLPECIRVSCGTRAETKRAVEVLNEVIADVEATKP